MQFDVYRDAHDNVLLDCQSEAMGYLATRITVPLLPINESPERRARLNPIFEIEGEERVMMPQFATAMRLVEMGKRVGNLQGRRLEIIGAFDMLLTGV